MVGSASKLRSMLSHRVILPKAAMSREARAPYFLAFLISAMLFIAVAQAKDLYKILGVDKGASQRDIQKSFHKLSLKFHPDKNPSKDAQAKFSEISNAYDILSDEEKRKQYDLYGEQQGFSNQHNGRGPFGGAQSSQGWKDSDFSGHNGGGSFYQQHYAYGSQEGPRGFSFHFGGRPQDEGFTEDNSFPFNFGGGDFMGSMFGSLFKSARSSGSSNKKHGGGFDSRQSGRDFGNRNFELPKEIEQLNESAFKAVLDGTGATSIVFFYSPQSVDVQEKSKVLEEVAKSLSGIVKVGAVNCKLQKKVCEEQAAKLSSLMMYTWKRNPKKGGLEYLGKWDAHAIAAQCIQLLPQISTLVSADDYSILFHTSTKLPRALLISKKKETPPMWRAISGVFETRVVFFDAQVRDATDAIAKRFGVKSLPAVVGILADGQEVLLTDGDSSGSVKAEGLKFLIEKLEMKNNEALSSQQFSSNLQFLTKDNFVWLCGVDTPLCIIAAARSGKGHEKAKLLLERVSQKNFVRAGNYYASQKKPSISYALLDVSKQKAFVQALGEHDFKSQNTIIVAYKPRKGKFALLENPSTDAEIETFINSALSGDLSFKKVKKEPKFS